MHYTYTLYICIFSVMVKGKTMYFYGETGKTMISMRETGETMHLYGETIYILNIKPDFGLIGRSSVWCSILFL